MNLVDIGANLGNKAFRADLDDVLLRAVEAGVEAIVVTGTSVTASRGASEIAEAPRVRGRSPRLFATAGIHPHHASTHGPDALVALRELCARPEVVAVGECGLDFDRNFSPRAEQLRCLEAHLELAADLAMPVFLHERAAHAEFAEILARHRPRLVRAVVHCFTGTDEALARYLDLDLHIGITGWICDERRGTHLRELVRQIPKNRLMLETDAPYILPRNIPAQRDLHGRKTNRNEPALLPYVLRAVAAARGESAEEVASSSTQTARAFFGLTDTA